MFSCQALLSFVLLSFVLSGNLASLSKVRDSVALLQVVDELIDHFSDQLTTDPFASIRAPLMRSRKVRPQDRKSAMTKAAKGLRQADSESKSGLDQYIIKRSREAKRESISAANRASKLLTIRSRVQISIRMFETRLTIYVFTPMLQFELLKCQQSQA